jgi:hypothetical protein
MPLFFLPFLYSQLMLTSATDYWSSQRVDSHSPSLPSFETIAQVLR